MISSEVNLDEKYYDFNQGHRLLSDTIQSNNLSPKFVTN